MYRRDDEKLHCRDGEQAEHFSASQGAEQAGFSAKEQLSAQWARWTCRASAWSVVKEHGSQLHSILAPTDFLSSCSYKCGLR